MQPRNSCFPGVQSFNLPEDDKGLHRERARGGTHPAGSRTTARTKRMAQAPGILSFSSGESRLMGSRGRNVSGVDAAVGGGRGEQGAVRAGT